MKSMMWTRSLVYSSLWCWMTDGRTLRLYVDDRSVGGSTCFACDALDAPCVVLASPSFPKPFAGERLKCDGGTFNLLRKPWHPTRHALSASSS